MSLAGQIAASLDAAVRWPVPDGGEICLIDMGGIRAPAAALVSGLGPSEQSRARRLVSDRRRREFAASRHLVRALRGEMASGRVCSWSRSRGWLAFASADVPALGVDLEIMRPLDFAAMLPVICEAFERETLSRAARLESPEAFFRIWTAKEAVMKAMREGFRAGVRTVRLPGDVMHLSERDSACLGVAGHEYRLLTRAHGPARISLAMAA